jgi:para-nitrobenzyl esterase
MNDTVNTIEKPTNIDPTVLDMFYANGKGLAWGPIVDGKIVPAQPSKTGVKVPSIFGSASQDGTLFVLASFEGGILNITETQYDRFLSYAFGPLASSVNKTYPLSKYDTPLPIPGVPPLPGFFAMSAVVTDSSFRCPAARGATTAAANGVPVWTYEFSHAPSCRWTTAVPASAEVLALVGAAHTSELPFVFGVVDGLPPPDGNCSLNAAERRMSSFMMDAWTSMAATGSPGASWPKFTAQESKGINFGSSAEAGVVDYSPCEFWNRTNAQISELDANRTSTSSATTTASGTGSAASATKTGMSSPAALVTGSVMTIGVVVVASLFVIVL